MFRIGQSVDIHPLEEGKRLVLGGVEIDSPKGLKGHSDADVLTHAIGESILGALALGDLGTHFPDTDPRYEGIRSIRLLDAIAGMMHQAGWKIANLDATVLAEAPKLAPWIPEMRRNIAASLNCDIGQVSIKATRGEKLGFVGRSEGMCALCVCLLESGGVTAESDFERKGGQ